MKYMAGATLKGYAKVLAATEIYQERMR